MVGEAPGYKGCGLTGIPFTSGDVITGSQYVIFKKIRKKIKLTRVISEATATIFWNLVGGTAVNPILWNAFPFHPHKRGAKNSNRRPSKEEINEGKKYLLMVYDIFCPKKLCAVGRVAEAVLKELFPSEEVCYIRHPARGGKRAFTAAVKHILEQN